MHFRAKFREIQIARALSKDDRCIDTMFVFCNPCAR